MTRKRECIDLSAFWDAVGENRQNGTDGFLFKGAGGEVVAETTMPWLWCKALVIKWLWDGTAELLAVSEDWAG